MVAYEGLCNILNFYKRKGDMVPIEALQVLKRDCDLEIQNNKMRLECIRQVIAEEVGTGDLIHHQAMADFERLILMLPKEKE